MSFKPTKLLYGLSLLGSFAGGVALGGALVKKAIMKNMKEIVLEEWNKYKLEEKSEPDPVETQNKADFSEFLAVSKEYRPTGKTEEETPKKGLKTAVKGISESDQNDQETEVKVDESEEVDEEDETFRSSGNGTIHTISEREYLFGEGFKKYPCNYYTGDDMFRNDDGDELEGIEEYLMDDWMDYFGTTCGDPDLVHIRNEEKAVDFEITRIIGVYNPK